MVVLKVSVWFYILVKFVLLFIKWISWPFVNCWSLSTLTNFWSKFKIVQSESEYLSKSHQWKLIQTTVSINPTCPLAGFELHYACVKKHLEMFVFLKCLWHKKYYMIWKTLETFEYVILEFFVHLLCFWDVLISWRTACQYRHRHSRIMSYAESFCILIIAWTYRVTCDNTLFLLTYQPK